MTKHKCILSCGICLKEHREILNRNQRAIEFVEMQWKGEILISSREILNSINSLLKGESH